MSLYNAIAGFSSECVTLLPMLGIEPKDYPRFRDCFLTDDNTIAIFTRVGGNNRNQGYGEEILYKHPNFYTTYDDKYDSTYGVYVFTIPSKWSKDFNKIVSGKFEDVSDDYVSQVKEIYPELAEIGIIDLIFKRKQDSV